jgi:TonB-dependent receptor
MSKKSLHSQLSLIGLGGVASLMCATSNAQSADAGAPPAGEDVGEIVVTGFRASLENATNAKRASTNVTDSVFAEDIGKFSDLNIAEALNRIPGVQLNREVNGDGLSISIRGLNTNFTKIVLNGAQIAVASSGAADTGNQNREVDLDLFPTELFTRLDVNKTPLASMLEGGVSGVVNMRSARPFDYDQGTHFTAQVQGNYGEISGEISPRAAFTGSWSNDTFGVLVGAAYVDNKFGTEGYESVGWSNANLTDAQCVPPVLLDTDNNPTTALQNICNYRLGGNNFSLPGTVPVGAGNGLVENSTLDAAALVALNPGLTSQQIGEALIPRLSRPVSFSGSRARYSGLVSLEYRPTDKLRFYGDTLYSKGHRQFDRLDMNWVVRNSNFMIPRNMEVDDNNVVTSGEFINSQFFLEARPYDETLDFWNFNPGMHVDFTEKIQLDFQLNKSRGWYYREAPTILVITPPNSGLLVNYTNNGEIPVTASNFDFNDPDAGWTWNGGRVNIQNEKRVTHTTGAHLDVTFGDEKANIKVGAAYDEISRGISGRDNSARWEDVVCRNGLDANGNSPATNRAACNGLNPNSAIPQAELASYLKPGSNGFITVDFDRFFADTNYRALSDSAPEGSGTATGTSTGGVNERTKGAYVELNGKTEFFDRELRFNAGGRWVQTDQAIDGPVTIAGVRQIQTLLSDYDAFLPSFNAAVNVTDDIVLRVAGSRTMTRANPSQMLPNTTFNDVSAQVASQGNPRLAPYLSTNFDIGGEWYTGDEGYVGLTLFAKQITGFTVNGANNIVFNQLGIPFTSLSPDQQRAINNRGGPDVAIVTVNQQVNAQATLKIQGYELNWVQPLSFVTDGLGFTANYTKVAQSVTGTGINPQATGIAPFTYNATVYYERGGFMARASYTHSDALVLTAANTGGQNGIPSAQLFGDPYSQLDLSSAYEFADLPGSPTVTLNVTNLLGEKRRSTFMFDNVTNSLYDPGYSVLLGLRLKF